MAGIYIALVSSAMRLSETITIYLAAGAPFGLYNFLRGPNRAGGFRSSMRAVCAALLWPVAAAAILFSRRRADKLGPDGAAERASAEFVEKVEQAQHNLMTSLYGVTELALASAGVETAKVERVSCAVRESVEKYVGLTLAAAECDPKAEPSVREQELCRVAGRRGDDLLLAGRCTHRRNVARLITHQARARTELLHALAEIREAGGRPDVSAAYAPALARDARRGARHLSVATVRFYCHAFSLLSLLEDEKASASVARLLDAECSRLRRLEELSQKEPFQTEEETCNTRSFQTIYAAGSQFRAANQG
jgi:hypothetical protein